MKCVRIIPLSAKPQDNQININKIMFELEHNNDITYIPQLCKGMDPYKFMLTYDYNENGVGVASPSFGVRVVEGSEDIKETESRINCAMRDLLAKGNRSFVNISRVSEFIYIILFEYKSGQFPIVRIRNSIYDCNNSSVYLSRALQDWEENEGMVPYFFINIDSEHIMYLCR